VTLPCPAQPAPRAVDDAGREIVLAAPARRIVSLAPHLTEMLFAAGAGERVVGVVEFSDHPSAARSIARIGSSRAVDLERIAALAPDLVVAWRSGNGERQISALRGVGLTVYENEPARLEDIPSTLQRLGALAGEGDRAERAARAFRDRREALERRYGSRPRVSVFHQIWASPPLTVNARHPITDVIELCGGRNVFAALPALTPTVSVEAVLAVDPEVISTAEIGAPDADGLAQWRRWPALTAVRRGNLVVLHPDLVSRHGPRILDGAEQLCEALEAARRRRG
jgi:iron complex transport system substrate-binding protein